MSISSWDKFFFEMCKFIGNKSKDPRTKVGCVIVDSKQSIRSTGFNGPPRGCNDERIIGRVHIYDYKKNIITSLKKKYLYFEHAERNAIYNAARIGVRLEGCIMYVNWQPCADCARAIIQSGISIVKIANKLIPKHWAASCAVGKMMMLESGVEVLNV